MLRASLILSIVGLTSAFPGADFLHPTIHFTPPYVSDGGGWHDVAGSLTHKGVHHVFQGTGWNHASSNDLVSWELKPHGPAALHETYAGMDSKSDPCSGFLTKDEKGTVCAGFRQCGSYKGVTGMSNWDVPLELRCAADDALTNWPTDQGGLDYNFIFNVSFWRPIPYDPARPWQDEDGNWYQLLSMDACNNTMDRKDPRTCPAGGQLVMWKSPALRGPKSHWDLVGPVFTDNTTVLKDGFLSHEFVTIDFLGSMEGDPSPQKDTKIFLNNVGGNGGGDGCCSGTTSYTVLNQPKGPGTPFVKAGPGQQMVDWGAFQFKTSQDGLSPTAVGTSPLDKLNGDASRGLSMARTLGSEDANQVTHPGRRVLIGWTGPPPSGLYANQGGGGSAQSLPRELSLNSEMRLMQRFVPELQSLRLEHHSAAWRQYGGDTEHPYGAGIDAVEVLASFPAGCGTPNATCGLTLLGDGSTGGVHVQISPSMGLITVNATTLKNFAVRAGPIPAPMAEGGGWDVHVYVDHSIVELIVNNDTAFVVYAAPASAGTQGNVAMYGLPTADIAKARLEVFKLKNAN